MITAQPHNYFKSASSSCDCSLGNILFVIAGVIGIATKNNYKYGFNQWVNQKYFVNKLPIITNTKFDNFKIYQNYNGFDVGFNGFDIPDNVRIEGYLGSRKYFEHCEDTIRKQFIMKDDFCDNPFDNCILIHYRDYGKNEAMVLLDESYYKNALKKFPKKRVVVVTDNIDVAYKNTKIRGEYTSNSPIIDFYLLSHAKYLIGSNSTFSWWAAYLSKAKTVMPSKYFTGSFSDCPVNLKDFYCDKWVML